MTDEKGMKMRRLDAASGVLREIILLRYGILPAVASLAATLLVIATFNDQIIEMTDFVRFLLTILLLIIPVSLCGLSRQLDEDEEQMKKILLDISGVEAWISKRSINFLANLPRYVVRILSLIVFVIVVLIWANSDFLKLGINCRTGIQVDEQTLIRVF